MSGLEGANARITAEVTSWDGVEAATGKRGEWSFTVGRREIGHLHGDHAAHFMLPKEIGMTLKAEGRVTDHPVFPGKPGPAARRIDTAEDEREVVELLRMNYDRVVERRGVPEAV